MVNLRGLRPFSNSLSLSLFLFLTLSLSLFSFSFSGESVDWKTTTCAAIMDVCYRWDEEKERETKIERDREIER
jgi:hypothetical protein